MTAISSLIVLFLAACYIAYYLTYPSIYPGVSVEGVDLSGYSLEEATEVLAVWQEGRHKQSRVLYFAELKDKLEADRIDFQVDVTDALATAWAYGRQGSYWERLLKIRIGTQNTYTISVKSNYNELKLNQYIGQWQSKIDRPASNATFSMRTGEMIPDQQGYKLESEILRQLIIGAFKKSEEALVLVPVTKSYPKVTVDDLATAGIREPISVYTTVFNNKDINRTTNIKLAAWKANGHIIYPEDVFSFNEIVGPREKDFGFKEALEIVDGEFVLGVGGGVCQLTSTLYNAVILANLDILERYNHSKVLSYVPLGRDATVAFGSLDFRFVNNTRLPVMIVTEVNGNELIVGVFGRDPIREKVEIIAVNQEDIPPVMITEKDDDLYVGETKIEKTGKPGVALTIMRVVRSNGQMIKQEILSKDRYQGEEGLLKVGTKIPVKVEEAK
jgi:vancomycin resistance protein YoaR